MTPADLSNWSGAHHPEPVTLAGQHVRLEPMGPHHAADLFAATDGHPELFTYLLEQPPADEDAVATWIVTTSARTDLHTWAVVDQRSGRAFGRQALMRVEPAHGVVELGSILWGPQIARTPAATEAFALHARYVFDILGYRRLEWKCDDRNEPSKRAAARFGFTHEGRFAQHMVIKGRNRDTTWFAMLDHEWPAQNQRLTRWLDPGNFDPSGRQRTPLERP